MQGRVPVGFDNRVAAVGGSSRVAIRASILAPWLMAAVMVAALPIPAFADAGTAVSYKSGSETVTAILYLPQGSGPFPALVVVHEYWGLNDWVKQQAAKLAGEGYAALAIDLYRGKVGTTPDEAHELMRGLAPDRVSRDLKAAFDYLASRRDVDPKRIGDIGWCMGGGYALDLAIAEPRLAAAVINYGHLMTDAASIQSIRAPVLGIFGGQDRGIPVEDVRNFERLMKAAGKPVEIVVYPDAGHGFQNPNNKQGYRAADAAEAWRQITAFLRRYLLPK
jgi:carboxymethylenebutenolidase